MRTLTHGLKTECEHEGVTRTMALQRYLDDDVPEFIIYIKTSGEDEIVTNISLSEFGYQMFVNFMQNAPHDLVSFEIKGEANDKG